MEKQAAMWDIQLGKCTLRAFTLNKLVYCMFLGIIQQRETELLDLNISDREHEQAM